MRFRSDDLARVTPGWGHTKVQDNAHASVFGGYQPELLALATLLAEVAVQSFCFSELSCWLVGETHMLTESENPQAQFRLQHCQLPTKKGVLYFVSTTRFAAWISTNQFLSELLGN